MGIKFADQRNCNKFQSTIIHGHSLGENSSFFPTDKHQKHQYINENCNNYRFVLIDS